MVLFQVSGKALAAFLLLILTAASSMEALAATPGSYVKAWDLGSGREYYCQKVSGKWASFNRKSGRFVNDAAAVRKAKKAWLAASGSLRSSLQSEYQIKLKQHKDRLAACPAAAKAPTARNASGSAEGMNVISLTLPVKANAARSKMNCFIEGGAENITFSACTLSARVPASGEREQNLKYYAVRNGKNRSKSADLRLTWQGFAVPLAGDISASASGVEPIPLSLPVQANRPATEISCVIENSSPLLKVENFPNCTALVTPLSHRIGNITLSYRAIRRDPEMEVSSAPASINLSWNQAAVFGGDETSLATYRDSLNEEEARYLARWANFGADSDRIVELATGPAGLDAAIELITSPAAEACPQVKEAALALARADRIRLCQGKSYNTTSRNADGSYRSVTANFCAPNDDSGKLIWNREGVFNYWLSMMLNSCQPLQERMGLLYHNHFVSELGRFSGSDSQDHYMLQHIDLLRSDIPGVSGFLAPFSFTAAQMDGADGSMLTYLNNNANTTASGNENYAREKLELFLMGVRDPGTDAVNYSERDIYELSFALTGYNQLLLPVSDPRVKQPYTPAGDAQMVCCDPANWINPDTSEPYHIRNADGTDGGEVCPAAGRCLERKVYAPVFDLTRWEDNPNRPRVKRIFAGTSYEIEGPYKADSITPDDTLTPDLMRASPIARYVGARLLGNFATITPSNDQIGQVASEIRAADFDLIPALRQIFSSTVFYSDAARYDSIANPIEALVSLIRVTGLPVVKADVNIFADLRTGFRDAGMELGRPASVFGQAEAGKMTGGRMHDGHYFLQTQLLHGRMNALSRVLTGVERLRQINPAAINNFTWESIFPAAVNRRDPEAVLNYLAAKLALRLSEEERALYLEYLTHLSMKTLDSANARIASPDPAFIRSVSWANLPQERFNPFFRMKISGLLELMAASLRANLK